MSAPATGWKAVRTWLRTADADVFIDEAVLGGLPLWEAVETLEDFGITGTREHLRMLGLEIDAAIGEGR